MRLIWVFTALASTLSGAVHYSYSGSDPTRWTRTEFVRPQAANSLSGYSTYIGDSNDYRVARAISDSAGNVYATGARLLAARNDGANDFGTDVFVTKLDPSGNLVFTATFSGKGLDSGQDIAVDTAGNIYVAGYTSSRNFPLRGAIQSVNLGTTGFLLKLSPDGSAILASTYFGGSNHASVSNIAVDAAGFIYLAGSTAARDFPVSPALSHGNPGFGVPIRFDAFVAKLTPAVDRIVYSGLMGGDAIGCTGGSSCFLSGRSTWAAGIFVDAGGNVILGGNTNVTDLPVTPGAMRTQGIGAFVAKIKSDGSGFAFLTYIGTRNDSAGPFANPGNLLTALTADGAGNPVIAGSTNDESFPATTGAFQPAYAGTPPQTDAFVAKLKADGSGMLWATYLGGTSPDAATSLAVDSSGAAWVSGKTESPEFPNANGWSTGQDFVVQLNASGSGLLYAARYPAGSASQSVALDARGIAYIVGRNGLVSAIHPGAPAPPRIFGVVNAAAGTLTGRVAPQEILSLYGPHIGPATPASFGTGSVPTELAGVQVFFNGVAAPLLYVADTQVNLIVPKAVGTSGPVRIQVVSGMMATPAFTAQTDAARPEIIQRPDGSAAAVNQDGGINSASNPATAGTIVTIWASGTGAITASDGSIAVTAMNTRCCEVLIDGASVPLVTTVLAIAPAYSGPSPGLIAAATQINFALPVTLDGPRLSVRITAGGNTSAAATLYVAP